MVFPTLCFAENKIYFDTTKNKEIVDVSGKIDIEQLKNDFNCPDLKDVTQERKAQAENNKIIEKEKKEQREIEIRQKENSIKQKLNLSDKDFQDLKEIIKE
jgi:hypothetical protein